MLLVSLEAPRTQHNGIQTAVLIASRVDSFRIQIKCWAPPSDNNLATFKYFNTFAYFAIQLCLILLNSVVFISPSFYTTGIYQVRNFAKETFSKTVILKDD